MLQYQALKNKRTQFFDLLGVPVEEFDWYIPPFAQAHSELLGPEQITSRAPAAQTVDKSPQSTLAKIEDRLLFIWLVQRAHANQEFIARQFELDHAEVDEWTRRLLPVFQLAMSKLSHIHLHPDQLRFLALLNQYEVEYLIIGGVAVALHGYLRPILDLDIFISTHPLNAQKITWVLSAFAETNSPLFDSFGVSPSLETAQIVEIFQAQDRVIRIGHPPFTVSPVGENQRFIDLGTAPTHLEIITSISAVSFEECYPERTVLEINAIPVSVIGLKQLKMNKQASIRLKDVDDFANLR